VFDDSNTSGGPSHWSIGKTSDTPPGHFILQTSNIGGGTSDGQDPVKPGTMLVRSDGSEWTDYRFSVYLNSTNNNDNAIGIVFRYSLDSTNNNNYYRFSMDSHQQKYRRLVKVVNGSTPFLNKTALHIARIKIT
jgi:hypothetical protein